MSITTETHQAMTRNLARTVIAYRALLTSPPVQAMASPELSDKETAILLDEDTLRLEATSDEAPLSSIRDFLDRALSSCDAALAYLAKLPHHAGWAPDSPATTECTLRQIDLDLYNGSGAAYVSSMVAEGFDDVPAIYSLPWSQMTLHNLIRNMRLITGEYDQAIPSEAAMQALVAVMLPNLKSQYGTLSMTAALLIEHAMENPGSHLLIGLNPGGKGITGCLIRDKAEVASPWRLLNCSSILKLAGTGWEEITFADAQDLAGRPA